MKKLLFGKRSPVEQKPLPSLAKCLLMDIIGSAVVVMPFIGDLIWAPISAVIFWRMFGFSKGLAGGIFSFVEELIPGLNFIPTFTIMWVVQWSRRKQTAVTAQQPVGTYKIL